MPAAFKRSLGSGLSTSSGTTVTITTTGAIDVGDLVVVRVASDNLSGTTPTFTVTDGGNTYTVLRQAAGFSSTAAAGVAGGMFATKATVARPAGSTITITLSGAVAHKAAYAESFIGADNTPRAAAIGMTGTATAASAQAFAGILAGDLVLGMIANETRGTITGDSDTGGGSSWSAQVLARSATSGTDANCVTAAGQYKVPTANATITYNVTAVAADWVVMCAVLQAAPGFSAAVSVNHAWSASAAGVRPPDPPSGSDVTLGNVVINPTNAKTITTPAGLEDGDHLVAWYFRDNTATDVLANIGIPGFTDVVEYATFFEQAYGFYIKHVPVAASEPATHTMTYPDADLGPGRLMMAVLKGAHPDTPIAAIGEHRTSHYATTPLVMPSVDPTVADGLGLIFAGGYAFTLSNWAVGAGYTVEDEITGVSTSLMLATADASIPDAPTSTVGVIPSDTSAKAAGVIVVFAPAPSVEPSEPPTYLAFPSVAEAFASTVVVTRRAEWVAGTLLLGFSRGHDGFYIDAAISRMTAPAAWTLVSRDDAPGGSNAYGFWWHVVAASGEPTSYTFGSDGSTQVCVVPIEAGTFNPDTPIDSHAVAWDLVGGNNTGPSVALTPVSGNTLGIGIYNGDVGSGWTAPATTTELYDATEDGFFSSLVITFPTSAGVSTGALVPTMPGTPGAERVVGLLVAIAPSSAPPPTEPSEGSAAFAWSETATAAGKRTPKATVVASWLETLTSVGKRQPRAIVIEAHTWTMTAVGVAPQVGVNQGSAAVNWNAHTTAAGTRQSRAEAIVAWSETVTAAGRKAVSGFVGLTWNALTTALGRRTSQGSRTINHTWAVTASGVRPTVGAKTGSASFAWTETATGVGKRTSKGAQTVAVNWHLNAQGVSPEVGVKQGTARFNHSWDTTASGRRVPKGSRVITHTWAVTATGRRVQRGTAALVYVETISASGRRVTGSSVLVPYRFVLTASGFSGQDTITGWWNGQEVVSMRWNGRDVVDWRLTEPVG